MTTKNEQLWMKKIMDMLEHHLGRDSEIVLHDIAKEYSGTIADIRNGHISGRRVGNGYDLPGREVFPGSIQQGGRYNFITHTRDAKILRSSSINLEDEQGKVVGVLAIHTNITNTIRFESFLRDYNNYHTLNTDGADAPKTVGEMAEYLIAEGQRLIGKPAATMNRAERIQMLRYLDDKGFFQLNKSGELACDLMGISRFTLYNYLDSVRDAAEEEESHVT